MAEERTTEARCDNCGYEAPDGSDAWESTEFQPLGTLTRCPDCGSTNVYSRG